MTEQQLAIGDAEQRPVEIPDNGLDPGERLVVSLRVDLSNLWHLRPDEIVALVQPDRVFLKRLSHDSLSSENSEE